MSMGLQEMWDAIAHACPHIVEWHDGKPYWRGSWSAADSPLELISAEFNPILDLNAMHAAEKVLTREQRLTYLQHLHCTPGLSSAPFATAAQRAEAFCRVMWPERFSS